MVAMLVPTTRVNMRPTVLDKLIHLYMHDLVCPDIKESYGFSSLLWLCAKTYKNISLNRFDFSVHYSYDFHDMKCYDLRPNGNDFCLSFFLFFLFHPYFS